MPRQERHLPGMAWTAIAFVPWIAYWVFAGMGNTAAAILSGLGISLAINAYRFASRKVKILDTVSLAFFAFSAFLTFVLGSDLLVFYGGVLVDTTLALMAWGSLLVGNPFTYDYAKEDWDRAFWDDPIFIRTNQIITALWGVIFAAEALIGGAALALGAAGMVRIVWVAVVPRLLLAAGIAFSAWFPHWYPQRAAARMGGRRIGSIPEGITGLRLVEFMPLAFDPTAAAGMQATVQFHLSGEGGGAGYLRIEGGRCTFRQGEAAQPDLTIESPAQVWTAIARGERSGAEALLNGAYTATGDLGLLLQFDTLFKGEDEP